MAFLGNLRKLLSFLNDGIENPEIIKFLKKRGLKDGPISSYEDFCSIKPLTKFELSHMQQQNPPFAGLVDMEIVSKVYLSPGPIFNSKVAELSHYRFYKALSKADFNKNDIVFNAFSYNMSPAGDMFDEAAGYLGAAVIPAGPSDSRKAAEIIEKTGATAFTGTRTFLFNILKHLGDKSRLKKAYLIAEKMTEKDRELFALKYGVQAYQGYGTAEVGLIATECSEKHMHPDIDIFLEVLEPGNFQPVDLGETGEAVITLMNGKLPFIRLATGDLTIAENQECGCGSDEGFIKGIFGRSDSSVKVKGIFVHYWQFQDFLEENGINGKLVVETTGNKDVLKMISNIESEGNLKQDFHKKFGLKLESIEMDKNLEENGIIDNRDRLKQS
ncbi:phenylacetate--CoA ligase family protein [Flexistipes sinusarabici]|uniref:Phenylacetate--CoA ligase n=1 Tax=Flexistipes sinusarabici TaxID=2352 RepID=A0A3D5Q8Q9_FLESI|nr:hypothetical protein [Flexistipes sinusarabici]HCW92231.1 hypothetical protein [Flexistipes sinusarabici]